MSQDLGPSPGSVTKRGVLLHCGLIAGWCRHLPMEKRTAQSPWTCQMPDQRSVGESAVLEGHRAPCSPNSRELGDSSLLSVPGAVLQARSREPLTEKHPGPSHLRHTSLMPPFTVRTGRRACDGPSAPSSAPGPHQDMTVFRRLLPSPAAHSFRLPAPSPELEDTPTVSASFHVLLLVTAQPRPSCPVRSGSRIQLLPSPPLHTAGEEEPARPQSE